MLTRILHMLGEQGPRTSSPGRFIRYLYNRLILENAVVRAAAVSALARFGLQVESLRPSVIVLIRRAIADNDDEVRDRATFFVNLLEKLPPAVASNVYNGKPSRPTFESHPPLLLPWSMMKLVVLQECVSRLHAMCRVGPGL